MRSWQALVLGGDLDVFAIESYYTTVVLESTCIQGGSELRKYAGPLVAGEETLPQQVAYYIVFCNDSG